MCKHSRIDRSWMRAVCVTICLLAAGPAGAQSPSPDTLAAARELIVTMRAADYFKTIMPAIVQQLKPAIVQNRPQVERDYDAIMPLMLDSMNARVSEIIDQVAALYARNFTAAELNEVVAFYRGPTGQKFIQKLPLITQESMVIGQRFGQSIAAELRSRIVDELRKRGPRYLRLVHPLLQQGVNVVASRLMTVPRARVRDFALHRDPPRSGSAG